MTRCGVALVLTYWLLLAGGSTAAAERPAFVPGQPVMIALGDSWPAGAGASPGNDYVTLLHVALRERYGCLPARSQRAADKCRQLQLADLAVGGATTPSLIAGQLPAALDLLEVRNGDRNPRNDVEVITLHIGGNDVVGPVLTACLSGLSPSCIATLQSELAAYRVDLEQLLSTLRDAAGPDTAIVIGTYDNPIAACSLGAIPGAAELGALTLEGGGPVPFGLHDVMRQVAAAHDVRVASVSGQLVPGDWVGGNDCLHPRDSGYAKVVSAFLDALGA
jgi:lysophospholipase L1-like esterase